MIFARALTAVVVGLVVAAAAPPSVARADGVRDQQWQLSTLRASAAWKLSVGGGVIVAVLDSGVDGTHPDLAGQVLQGTDLVEPGGNGWHDPVGHGTTVAALIAGRADDADGVAGLAPGARILPVRVLDAQNRFPSGQLIATGLRWAVDHGARVANLSLGGAGRSPELADAIAYARDHDVVLVASSGNLVAGGTTEEWYPARDDSVLDVTGLTREDTLWSEAISGPATDLAAPATAITGARPGGYWQVHGTSFAAPLVSAAAALVRAHWPAMDAGGVIDQLERTATDLGAPGRDDVYGHGLVDPVRALTEPAPYATDAPPLSLAGEPVPGGAGSGYLELVVPVLVGLPSLVLVGVVLFAVARRRRR